MENIEISGSEALRLQILQLKADKSNCEDVLNQSFKELTQFILVPIHEKKENPNVIEDDRRALINLSEMVVNKTTNYIIEQNFGQKQRLNDFLISLFVNVFSNSFINKKITTIISEMNNQVFEKDEEND